MSHPAASAPPVAANAAAAGMPAPAGPVGPTSTAHAPTLTMAHLQSQVGPGKFPSLEAAYQDATRRGYVIQGQ